VKQTQNTQKYLDSTVMRWILFGLAATTLYFQINVADPFNSPKMWIIFIFSSWLIGYLVSYRKVFSYSRDYVKSAYIVLIFIITMGFASVFTDVKYIALFGDTQRKNGFLTYVGLSVIFLSTLLFFRIHNIKRLFSVTLYIALASVLYGFLQTTGNDFVDWLNPHNSLIGTQGNPNFASAVMAIMSVLLYSSIFLGHKSRLQKIIPLLISVTLVILILRSNARQGLLSFILGVSVFNLIWLIGKNRKLGLMFISAFIPALITGVLGMLQIGPLQNLLYKPSVSVRGYYWRAGWEMLKDNLLTGVGVDRYGAYFMQYREVGYPLNYGFEITSSNAHNTFIQFFATGGVFLGSSYLLLTFWIFTRAIKGLRELEGESKLILAGLFSAWIAFHAQSFVSIDNLGVSIWGWVLGGAIVGVSAFKTTDPQQNKEVFRTKLTAINLNRVVISGCAGFLAIMLVATLYRGENNTYKSAATYSKQDQAAIEIFRTAQLKIAKTPLIDINYELRAAQNLIQYGLTEDGLFALDNVLKRDSRNLDTLNFFALTYENYSQFEKAIPYRAKIIELNPWNAPNYLQLGINYKRVGNDMKATEMLEILSTFSTGINGGPILEEARRELS
jgi:O-antigen ligase